MAKVNNRCFIFLCALFCTMIFFTTEASAYGDSNWRFKYPKYKLMPTISDVVEDKKFIVTFTDDISVDSLKNNIELWDAAMQNKLPVDVVLIDGRRIEVIPKEQLKIGQAYFLVVCDSIKNSYGMDIANGTVCIVKTITEEHANFIQTVSSGAKKTYDEYGIFPSVTIAQAIIESGWGTSDKAQQCNNLFGIKADSTWTGEKMDLPTKEWQNGGMVDVMASWRAYATWEDSIEDHGKMLREKPRYAQNGVFSAPNYEEQIKAIKKAGYATDPNYVKSICSIINRLDLWQYDPDGMELAVN